MGDFDGITVNGEKTVEQFLQKKTNRVIAETRQTENKVSPYRHRKLKYADHKEPHGKVKIMSKQSELNRLQFRDNLDNFGDTPKKYTICFFLMGMDFDSASVVDRWNKDKPKKITSTTIASVINEMVKWSELGKYIIRTNHSSEKRPRYIYSMTEEGRSLKPLEAFAMAAISGRRKNKIKTSQQASVGSKSLKKETSIDIPENINVNVNIKVTFSFE